MATKVTNPESLSEVQQRNLRTTRHTVIYEDAAEAFENSLSRTLGIDIEGSTHHFDAHTKTVTVVAMDGSVERVEELAAQGRTVAEWDAYVAHERGWL
ncbi:hypothetical protein [Halomarina rubra]|uniref:Uncharacterized protein n=1 Tax=Halomarina rubra TaxID=2071873 RepID=A0ABD6AU67_9EURY|nr:hypothetical protein [Halomarina rubra]